MNSVTTIKNRVGAPSIKTPELCKAICEGIAVAKSARSMCNELGISQRVLWEWLQVDAEFAQQYARAKEMCADFIAAEIIEIADESSRDILTREDGSTYIDNEAVQRSRLRVDARKWYAGKLAPKKYGDKVIAELQGGDPDKPITQNITIAFVPPNPQK